MEKIFGKYGLPLEVKFCKKCTMNNQRPSSTVEFKQKEGEKKRTLAFGKDGICEACRYAEQKKSKKSEKSNVTKITTSVIIDESKAIKYINTAKVITVQDLARQTEVKISAANSYLQKLLKDGAVERIGGFSGHHLYKSVSGK